MQSQLWFARIAPAPLGPSRLVVLLGGSAVRAAAGHGQGVGIAAGEVGLVKRRGQLRGGKHAGAGTRSEYLGCQSGQCRGSGWDAATSAEQAPPTDRRVLEQSQWVQQAGRCTKAIATPPTHPPTHPPTWKKVRDMEEPERTALRLTAVEALSGRAARIVLASTQ